MRGLRVNEVLPVTGQHRWVLEAKDLSVARGNRVVFQGVNLALTSGELVALTGCNGTGKTTLLLSLAGGLLPAGGEVFWRGKKSGKNPTDRKQIGFVGHESGLYLALTVWENLLFAGRMWGIDAPKRRAADWLSKIGLEKQAAQDAAGLSRGMRQRLAIARALIHDPDIVLLDEPYSSLDVDGREWLTMLLCSLRSRNRAIILATHDPVHASEFVDRMVNLRIDGLREVNISRNLTNDCKLEAFGGRQNRPQSASGMEAA